VNLVVTPKTDLASELRATADKAILVRVNQFVEGVITQARREAHYHGLYGMIVKPPVNLSGNEMVVGVLKSRGLSVRWLDDDNQLLEVSWA
jgi:hypothetical protein